MLRHAQSRIDFLIARKFEFDRSNLYLQQQISLKMITDDVTDDIFDMSTVRYFKEIEKKKVADVYTLLCFWSAELSKAFRYTKTSVVMLLGPKTRVRTKSYALLQKCYMFI